jgi:K+-transporting ATPase A subunit
MVDGAGVGAGIFTFVLLSLICLVCGLIISKSEEYTCKQVSGKPYCYQEWVAYDEAKK